MTLIRLGKTRESTIFTAEQYKDAIRKYMESLGYGQSTDSFIEGHLTDMIFLPLSEGLTKREIWVEAKASKVSLANNDFKSETRNYLKQWILRTPESRFKLMIFAEELANPTKWERIWGNDIEPDEILDWLGEKSKGDLFRELKREFDLQSIFAFFAESYVIQGNRNDLLDSAAERVKVGVSASETRRNATKLLKSMEDREQPTPKKSTLFANLIHLVPPNTYKVLEVDQNSRSEVRAAMNDAPRPPFATLGKGKLLTLDLEESEVQFKPLNPRNSTIVQITELSQLSSSAFPALMNDALDDMIRALGLGRWEKWYYFLAAREANYGSEKNIVLPDGRTLLVARPFFTGTGTNDFIDRTRTILNFVFNQGFSARYKSVWNDHFVELRTKRIYTTDGANIMAGDQAGKIDSHFRNSMYNRADTQQNKMAKLAEFLFLSRRSTRRDPTWISLFSFDDFLNVSATWAPQVVDLKQDRLSM